MPERTLWSVLFRRYAVFVCFALAVLGAAPAEAALRVVATVPALGALAREVGGAHVDVRALARPTQDPHFVDARPSLALELNRADLLLAVGLGLEAGWLPTLITGARNARIIPGAPGHLDCSQFARLLEVPAGPIDRSHGDVHPGGNPHYLTDPRAAAAVARGVAARLGQLDPPNRAAFDAGLSSFLSRLSAAQARWEASMKPYAGAPFIGYHRTWVYVADWLKLVEAGFVEPKPGIPPNPAHVAQLVAMGKSRAIRVIAQEEYYPDKTSRLVAERIGATLVRVPGGPDLAKGQTYGDYLERVIAALRQGWGAGGARP